MLFAVKTKPATYNFVIRDTGLHFCSGLSLLSVSPLFQHLNWSVCGQLFFLSRSPANPNWKWSTKLYFSFFRSMDLHSRD